MTLRDFSILHGRHFSILATGVDHLAIDHLKIDTNRDGMDIDVRARDCSNPADRTFNVEPDGSR